MKGRKVYGASKINTCPFCGASAFSANEQGVPTCQAHKNRVIANFKCVCGDWLDLLKGKWGPFFRCMKCGTVNFQKGLSLNRDKLYQSEKVEAPPKPGEQKQWQPPKKETPPHKEFTVRSDEIDFWFE